MAQAPLGGGTVVNPQHACARHSDCRRLIPEPSWEEEGSMQVQLLDRKEVLLGYGRSS